MPSAVVSRMAASSSASAWPTAMVGAPVRAGRPGIGLRNRGRDGRSLDARAGENQSERGIAVPGNRVEAGVGRPMAACPASDRRLACRNHHRRAGVRRRGRVGHTGFDIERVEAAGIFQRMQARIAHLRQEGRVGVEQPVEPVDQDADRQQIEQRLVAPGFAARRRLRRRQPLRLHRGSLATSWISAACDPSMQASRQCSRPRFHRGR